MLCLADYTSDYSFQRQTLGHPSNLTHGKYQTQVLLSSKMTSGENHPSNPGFWVRVSQLRGVRIAIMTPAPVHPNYNYHVGIVHAVTDGTFVIILWEPFGHYWLAQETTYNQTLVSRESSWWRRGKIHHPIGKLGFKRLVWLEVRIMDESENGSSAFRVLG